MELLKVVKAPAEYKWKDVVFKYRTQITTADKFSVDTAGQLMKDGSFEFNPWEFYRSIIRTFVIDWEGVTQDGAAVPYSFDAFCKLPSDPTEDLIMKLGIKIAQDTGFLKTDEQRKSEEALKNG